MLNVGLSPQLNMAGTALTYDYDNRLSGVSNAGAVISYLYDGSEARIGRVANGATNHFVVDYADGLKRPLAEADDEGHVTRFYIWAGSRLLGHVETNGTRRYYHADELGSTLALTDEAGNVTDQFGYSPYGQVLGRTGSTETPFLWLGGYGVYYDSSADFHLTLHRAYSAQMRRFISPDPLGIEGGPNLYAYANNNPLLFIDPYGLWSWNQTFGVVRAVGGGLEAAAGYSLATASAAFGAASSWTGVGLAAGAAGTAGGIAVGAHGVDQFQAGIRQAFADQQMDSLTSVALQETTGMSQNTANLVDTGISVVGSLGAGTATAGIRAAHIAATDDLAQGLTRMQILSRWESGSRALNADDWAALGRQATSPLDKARMIEQGVNAAGQPYQLTTTFMQRIGQSTRLAPTGLTPYGAAGAGAGGAGLAGVGGLARPPK